MAEPTDSATISFVDQLTASLREVFHERGYPNATVSIAVSNGGRMHFNIDPKSSKITQEEFEGIMDEATQRIGCKKA